MGYRSRGGAFEVRGDYGTATSAKKWLHMVAIPSQSKKRKG